jgi:hypothetical protein
MIYESAREINDFTRSPEAAMTWGCAKVESKEIHTPPGVDLGYCLRYPLIGLLGRAEDFFHKTPHRYSPPY